MFNGGPEDRISEEELRTRLKLQEGMFTGQKITMVWSSRKNERECLV